MKKLMEAVNPLFEWDSEEERLAGAAENDARTRAAADARSAEGISAHEFSLGNERLQSMGAWLGLHGREIHGRDSVTFFNYGEAGRGNRHITVSGARSGTDTFTITVEGNKPFTEESMRKFMNASFFEMQIVNIESVDPTEWRVTIIA